MDSPDPKEKAEDTLHVGATRQAMWLGIPMPLTVGLGLLTYLILVNVAFWHSIVWAVVIVGPIWAGATIAVRRSPFGINVIFAWVYASAMVLDRGTWHGCSRSPLPARQSSRTRGMRHAG